MPSVYIHIPFCQSRCIYCDFYSTTHLAQQEQYVDCLIREMEQRQDEWAALSDDECTSPGHDECTSPGHGECEQNDKQTLRARSLSIYIGGGTPSTLPPRLLKRLLDETVRLFPPREGAEITLEANPDDVTEEFIATLKQTPVNRISMGVQTFDDLELHTLRRRHSAQQAIEAVRMLREAGYENLSIDLIYGLPGQTLEAWEANVDQAIALRVPHLSAYSLMYEEGTPLFRMLEKGEIREMDDETSWRCYELLCHKLQQAGYEHYEISNFALPGCHSRHNSGYWNGTAYLGFGAGAHSYDGRRHRRGNLPSLHNYLAALSEDGENQQDQKKKAAHTADTPHPYFEIEALTDTDLYNEFVMTRLRTSAGFCLEEVERQFGESVLQHCQEMLKPHLQQGNLVQMESQIYLSRKGIFISNEVISDLFL